VVVLAVPEGLRAAGDPGLGPMPLINPVVTPLTTDEMENWEGCLSIPGMIGRVPRPRRIRLDWLDLEGQEHAQEIEGFPAAAVQHECDHLDGVLYVDRIRDLRTFQFTDEYQRQNRR
jgi:peptide deformylase